MTRRAAALAAVTAVLRDNPVFVREARTRMRGARGAWILAGYLTVLGGTLALYYLVWLESTARFLGGVGAGSAGRELFSLVAGTQTFLVLLITPAIAAGAISLEREQRTLEMLEVTPMSRFTIVVGKLLSAFAFVAFLVVSSLPLASLCFLLGGVSPEQVTHAYVMLLTAGLVQAGVATAWSSVARSTSSALSYSYSTFVVFPLAIVAALAAGAAPNPSGSTVAGVLAAGLCGLNLDTAVLGSGSAPVVGAFFGLASPRWLAPAALGTVLAAVLVAVSAAALERYPERRAPVARWLALLLIALVALFACGSRGGGALAPGAPAAVRFAAPSPALAVAVLALFMMAPAFATGVVTQAQARRLSRWLADGWTRDGARRSDLASALPYLLTCAAAALGIYALSLALTDRPVDVLPAAAIMSAALFSTWCVGLALSLALRSRWMAGGMLYVLYGLSLLGAFVATAALETGSDHASARALVNLAYLNPVAGVLQGGSTLSAGPTERYLFGKAPFWVVGSIAHLVIGVVALMVASSFVGRAAVRQPDDDDRHIGRPRRAAA